MSEVRKHDHKHGKNVRNNNFRDPDPQDKDTMEEDEKWNPTPEQFTAYQLRDAALCTSNLQMLLASRSGQTFRDLKDSTLHTAGTVEAQLNHWIKTGYVVEVKGRYSLATANQGR